MKKTIFGLIISLAFFSHSMNAQNNQKQPFKDQYLQQAEKNAEAEAKAQLALITHKYKLDPETYKTLYETYYNRRIELEKAMMSSEKSKKSQNNLTHVISKYDSISNYYLQALKNKSLIGDKVLRADDNSKFASAVRSREKLKLDKTQIENLIYQSKLMAEKKAENEYLDLKDYERKILPTILTDEQYTQLLIDLNKKTANAWAKGSWQKMKERGIDEGLDSTKVQSELFNYNLAKLVKKERFGKDVPKTSESMRKMNTTLPESLRRLQSDETRNTSKKSEETKTKFAW
ncbi:hypothetical protein [Flavobacterium chungangense]|uniref:DUF3826 domain-containing protein n=1 Tax=Flavobacterium chungangense TaxID=554283 RepID=A0A6V6YS56_9FLAO|nr:hypothetical protein [Flavobacterium chungangense]CAD0002246.1 hypothetical protein FLACHUCJ7_00905 [Flavobacterium chungangense]